MFITQSNDVPNGRNSGWFVGVIIFLGSLTWRYLYFLSSALCVQMDLRCVHVYNANYPVENNSAYETRVD